MSGVEVIAIVSCVAGLIEALDSGCRIVKQIKERRKAHRADGALPPSDELEKTIEEGKNSIQELVDKGNKRFGPGFEEGDATAQLAIMRITIQIQNVLLDRLTQARTDDGVIDFRECIDLSDEKCNEALIALRGLYQRKLQETMSQKSETETVPKQRDPEPGRTISRVNTEPVASTSTSRTSKPPVKDEEPATASCSERKNSKGLRHRLFHSKDGETARQEPTSPPPYHRVHTAPADIPKPSRRSTVSSYKSQPSPQQKRASEYSISSQKRASEYSVSSQNSSNPDQVESYGRGTESHSWTQGMSRASTLGPVAFMEPMTSSVSNGIAKFGGCCKYAYNIRDKGPKGNLEAQNTAFYGENWVLQCKSQKCKFGKQASSAKVREQVDNTVYSRHGLQFRWIFLAKSHCQQNEVSRDWPYVCLVCQLLNHDPHRYLGVDSLFAHIAQHREKDIDGVALEGPLTFSNKGIERDAHFDLNLPEQETPQLPPATDRDQRVVGELQTKLRDLEVDRTSKTSSLESNQTGQTDESSRSAHTDPFENPWRD